MYCEYVVSEQQIGFMKGFLYKNIQQMKEDEIRIDLGDSPLHSSLFCSHYLPQIHTFFFTPVSFLLSAISCAGLQETIPWDNAQKS